MKIRIGVGYTRGPTDGAGFGAVLDSLTRLHFDSLWLSEVLTGAVPDPLAALAFAAGRHPRLKLGTTMLLPGHHPLRLAKQLATIDALSGGRLLVTFVPGLARSPEREAVGVPLADRGSVIDEMMPLLRRLWSGETVTYRGAGPSAAVAIDQVTLSPLPVQQPLELWLGGMASAALDRCGRLGDGWLPSLCTPAEVAAGREVIDRVAERSGRRIDPEHFGVSLGYSFDPLDDAVAASIGARSRGNPVTDVVAVGERGLRDLVHRFVDVGFSKFVARPLTPPADWPGELERLAGAVGDLQT